MESLNDIENKVLLKSYFGRSENYYLEQIDGEQIRSRFSFYAFFLNIYWFVYRKMYLEAILLVGMFVLDIVVAMVTNSWAGEASYIVSFIFVSVCGFLGNSLYLKKAQKMVSEAQYEFETEEEQIAFLEKKGGVSYIALTVLIILSLGAYLFKLQF